MRASRLARARRCLIALAIVCLASTGSAQDPLTFPMTHEGLRDDLDKRCENASVIVLRCIAPRQADRSDSGDALEQSRQRTKAAFDRRDRRSADQPRDGGDAIEALIDGRVQRLAPVIVTGQTPYVPAPTVEQILDRALRPPPPSAATVMVWNNDGGRTECIARCVGPMCCTTVSAQSNPARDAFAIGR